MLTMNLNSNLMNVDFDNYAIFAIFDGVIMLAGSVTRFLAKFCELASNNPVLIPSLIEFLGFTVCNK